MDVAAFVPLSLSDHEGHVAAVVFVHGCNFRCPFCHNADLVLPDRDSRVALRDDEVIARLRDRRGFLDSVVVSGGEPTLQRGLADFLAEVKRLGFGVKLDTNGLRSSVVADLLEEGLVDYVAMDLKAPPGRYAEFAGVPVALDAIRESVSTIRERAPDYEFRTTVAPGLAGEDLVAIAQWIRGAKRYILQPFRVPSEKHLLDPAWAGRDALPPATLRETWSRIAPYVCGGGVRA